MAGAGETNNQSVTACGLVKVTRLTKGGDRAAVVAVIGVEREAFLEEDGYPEARGGGVMTRPEQALQSRLLAVAGLAELLTELYEAPVHYRGLTWDANGDAVIAKLREAIGRAHRAKGACRVEAAERAVRPFLGTVTHVASAGASGGGP